MGTCAWVDRALKLKIMRSWVQIPLQIMCRSAGQISEFQAAPGPAQLWWVPGG